MKGIMHERISAAAVTYLPEEERKIWNSVLPELLASSNYPDFFFGYTEPNLQFETQDPEWMDFVVIELENGLKFNCHRPGMPNAERIMFAYWFPEIIKNIRCRNFSRAAKFIGCASHIIADSGQPAHNMNEKIASDLFMQGNVCGIFHQIIESIEGEIPSDIEYRASLLASSSESLAWIIPEKMKMLGKKERGEIPVLFNGLERHDEAICRESAGRTASHCAFIIADLMHTLYMQAIDADLSFSCTFDLCGMVPASVQSDAYMNLDIMLNRVPGPDPYHPLPLDPGDGKTHHGFAMLPHLEPLRHGTREAWVEYVVPPGMFKRFTATVGLCRGARNEEGLAFEVLLDGQVAFCTGKVNPDEPPVLIDVALDSASAIRLRAVDVREDQYRTKFYWPIWCEPLLYFS